VLEKAQLSLKQEFSLLQIKERKASEQHLLMDRKQRILEEKKKLEEQEKALGKPQDISVLDKEIDSITQAIDYQTKKEQLSGIIEKQDFFSKKLSNISYDDNNYLSLLADLINQEEKLNNNAVQISLIQGIIKNLESTKAQYEKLSLQLQEKQAIITKLETKQKDMTFFVAALENSQEHLRRVLVDNINQTLEIIWPKVYPYGDYLSARLRAENDYVLEVLTLQKEWIRVEGLLSGGERTCAALSIRVAIALSLTKKLGLLILDEPTHNLDSKTITMLSSILDKELPELVEQIFIITHDQKLLETSNSSKYIIERDKENDGVSFVKEE
jgi:DNA repair protein SbcC/Rad50